MIPISAIIPKAMIATVMLVLSLLLFMVANARENEFRSVINMIDEYSNVKEIILASLPIM
jgi:hypothetical protein